MSLLEAQKAERRARILTEARRLVVERGWDGTTMRDLADASRVSVPTVYNLIGGKESLLAALMEDLFVEVSRSRGVSGSRFLPSARAIWEAGLSSYFAAPDYLRRLVGVFLATPSTAELRCRYATRYIELMAECLSQGQAEGELSTLVSAQALAETMFSLWDAETIRWAHGGLDDEGLRRAVERGMSLLLLAVAQGDTRTELARTLERAREPEPDASARGTRSRERHSCG